MTLTEFKAYVRRDLKRTDKDTEIVQAYNDMIKWLAAKMPIGDYKFFSYVPVTEEVEDYELPCDLLHLIHPVMLLDGDQSNDSGHPLDHLTLEQYRLREPNPNRNNPIGGKPTAYTIFSRSLLLTPIPDNSNYILEIAWGKRPTTQSNGEDVPDLGEEFDEVLKWGTLERVYEGMQLYEDALYWGSKYRDQEGKPTGALRDLMRNERGREEYGVGQVRNNNL